MKTKNRLIVALDINEETKALTLVKKLKKSVKMFKVGSELFSSCGPDIVAAIKKNDCDIFLDLKFHDIPNTVANAAVSVTRLGVSIFNVHALGGPDMMEKAAEAARGEADRLKIERPKVIAVTILTSMDENGLKKIGISDNIKTQVIKLAILAKEAGLDGVVASPEEASIIRVELGKDFLIVTPGIRPSWAVSHDQKRVATPKEAITAGADYIVVGRPIIKAEDPLIAAQKILEEIEE